MDGFSSSKVGGVDRPDDASVGKNVKNYFLKQTRGVYRYEVSY